MKRMIVANKICSSRLEKLNEKTYVEDLNDGMYLNIRQAWGDSDNYNAGEWLWDLTDGSKFIDFGPYGWETPEAAAEDFYFRHPEYEL